MHILRRSRRKYGLCFGTHSVADNFFHLFCCGCCLVSFFFGILFWRWKKITKRKITIWRSKPSTTDLSSFIWIWTTKRWKKKMVLIHVIYHRANVSDVIFTMRVGFSISFHSSKTGVAFHPGRSICCHFSYCHRQNSIFISKHSCQAMAAMNPIYSYFDINFQSNEGV